MCVCSTEVKRQEELRRFSENSSHTQHVTRSAETGEYAKEDSDPKTAYETDEEHKSAWKKEAVRLLDSIEISEAEATLSGLSHDLVLSSRVIALVIHCQVLKRP